MTNRPDDTSADWRRRQRGRGGRGGEPPAVEAGEGLEPEEEPGGSRTLFSFLEPGLNVIGSFGAPVVIAGIFALILGVALAAFVSSLRLYGFIIIGVGVVFLVTIGLIYLSSVFAAFISRTGRYGVNSLVMLAAFIGILVVVNFVTFSNNSRIDTTATQQFSLSTGTKNLLNELPEPVRALAFFREDLPFLSQDQIVRRVKVEDTLSEFSNRSNQFTYQFVDPDIDPEIARNFGVTTLESIVVEGVDSQGVDLIEPTDQFYTRLEQALYTGILVATGQEQRTVYFLAGHGERNIISGQGDGYESIRQGLEQDNYQVQPLRWNAGAEDVSIPDDAALLVIAGPSGELPEAHLKALDDYLSGVNADGTARREGGRMIFLGEPNTPASWRDFLIIWGVVINPGYILDQDRSVPGTPQTLRLGSYNPEAPQEIVFPRGVGLDVSFLPGAAALVPINDQTGNRLAMGLAVTSGNSYLIDDVERTEPITDAGDTSDPQGFFFPALFVQAVGPVGSPPMSAAPATNQIAEMVVFGDADFIGNANVSRGSGAAMFLNSANYLMGDYDLTSIRDRQFVFREFNLDQNQFNFVRFSSWFFLPGLMALLAAMVWWVRR